MRLHSLVIFRTLILLLVFRVPLTTFAQNNRLGTWNILNVQYNFNKKWSAFYENQLRSQKPYQDFFYHELKAGVGYNASNKTVFLLGNGFYQTYSLGGNFKSPVVASEYRLWEQIVVTNNISRLKLEHRYRAEQRWLSQGFRNRFRYRLNAVVPLNRSKVEKGTLYATAFDEVFFTDKTPYFQRNRFFAGFGYEFTKNFILQAGYIRQFDYNVSTSAGKNFVQSTLLFNVHGQRTGREQHPSTMD